MPQRNRRRTSSGLPELSRTSSPYYFSSHPISSSHSLSFPPFSTSPSEIHYPPQKEIKNKSNLPSILHTYYLFHSLVCNPFQPSKMSSGDYYNQVSPTIDLDKSWATPVSICACILFVASPQTRPNRDLLSCPVLPPTARFASL